MSRYIKYASDIIWIYNFAWEVYAVRYASWYVHADEHLFRFIPTKNTITYQRKDNTCHPHFENIDLFNLPTNFQINLFRFSLSTISCVWKAFFSCIDTTELMISLRGLFVRFFLLILIQIVFLEKVRRIYSANKISIYTFFKFSKKLNLIRVSGLV